MEAIKRFLMTKHNAGELNIDKLCVVGVEFGLVAVNWAAHDWSWPSWPPASRARTSSVRADLARVDLPPCAERAAAKRQRSSDLSVISSPARVTPKLLRKPNGCTPRSTPIAALAPGANFNKQTLLLRHAGHKPAEHPAAARKEHARRPDDLNSSSRGWPSNRWPGSNRRNPRDRYPS